MRAFPVGTSLLGLLKGVIGRGVVRRSLDPLSRPLIPFLVFACCMRVAPDPGSFILIANILFHSYLHFYIYFIQSVFLVNGFIFTTLLASTLISFQCASPLCIIHVLSFVSISRSFVRIRSPHKVYRTSNGRGIRCDVVAQWLAVCLRKIRRVSLNLARSGVSLSESCSVAILFSSTTTSVCFCSEKKAIADRRDRGAPTH